MIAGKFNRDLRDRISAFTILELIVTIAIVAMLVGLMLMGVQRVRESAARVKCASNLRNLSHAFQNYEAQHGLLPPGMSFAFEPEPFPDRANTMTWHLRLLPFVEHDRLWNQALEDFAVDHYFIGMPPHRGQSTVIAIYLCPSESRLTCHLGWGLTSYIGVSGTQCSNGDGLLFYQSRVRMLDIVDGTSHTLIVGERPPSAGQSLGRWYGGWGQAQNGWAAQILGMREVALLGGTGNCSFEPQSFRMGRIDEPCDAYHYWSLHSGGGNFAFGDGSVRFMRYSGAAIMPALSTRAGGESDPSLD